jgi:hypothetical protein
MSLTMKQRRTLHTYNDKPDFPVSVICWIVGVGILLLTIWEHT